VARFEAERQALALMDHPCIARVLDGGATSSGRPYFVMELVKGLPITEYCDKNALDTAARLDLFTDVCHAVQHAHQKGIIHRDLKPSNVLVTTKEGRAVPMVIDFGVAKAMHGRLTEKTLFTRYEQFIGTPAYMSPEQSEPSALDVDTRTDIYSLGVLLYELLTGTTPFSVDIVKDAGLAEIRRWIREEIPQRPSARVSTSREAGTVRRREIEREDLSRRLRGDLDWIVLRALEKDRNRRYGSAGEMAEDIRRHVRREPVLAGPPGAVYRLSRFFARNRAAVISASLILMALLAGMVGTTLGMLEASKSADEAKAQARHALTALDFCLATLSLTDPSVARNPAVTVESLLEHAANQVGTVFAGQPWAEARVRSTIGRAYRTLGKHDLAETHLRRAVEIALPLSDEAHASGTTSVALDDGELYATLWALTNVCFYLERGDAFAMAQKARSVGLRHIGQSHPDLAQALLLFNSTVEGGAWGQDTEALAGTDGMMRAATALADRVLGSGDPLWPIVADTLLACGYSLWYTPHEAHAEVFWRKALDIQTRELGPEHPDTSTTVQLLVGLYSRTEKADEAEELILSSLESLKRTLPEGSLPIAVAESGLGETRIAQGRYDEAEEHLLVSHVAILEAVGDEANWMAVESFLRLIALYDAWEQPEKGSPYRDALARTCLSSPYFPMFRMAQPIFGPEHAGVVSVLTAMQQKCTDVSYRITPGSCADPGLDELVPLLREELQKRLEVRDLRCGAVARLLIGFANAVSPTRPRLRESMAQLALDLIREGGFDLAREEAEALSILAERAFASGDRQRGQDLLDEIRRRLPPPMDRSGTWFTLTVQARIGRTFSRAGRYDEAARYLVPAHAVLVSQLGASHAETQAARDLLHELYTKSGRPAEARAFEPPERLPTESR
jgi:tetratricopeptide (TPR) repeat protein